MAMAVGIGQVGVTGPCAAVVAYTPTSATIRPLVTAALRAS